ncbi:MAG: ADP-ribosylglycohydrolase family protein [Albidovulum sp.]|nr:ADP-ribosylglycohydrolase family protein [Albidovulum sp.]
MAKTSITHPIRIDALPVGNGSLGITICPGKKGDSVFGSPWARDLDLDMDAVGDWGATAVLTLIEDHEFESLSVRSLGDAVKTRDIEWHHFPILDGDVPTAEAMGRWRALSPRLHQILERRGRLVVHCRGGLGRAGTIAALILIERGRSAPDAIREVRSVRRGAVETVAQERWLASRAPHRGPLVSPLHASLVGGAIGDSLGAEIEFLPLSEIRRRFPEGVSELPVHQGLRGAITDDTQMTLFTAEGMIRAHVRGAEKGIFHPPSVVHHALLRWHRTQGGKPRVETDNIGLISDPRLSERRAPGHTCMSALATSESYGAPARNDSKGCGTIMRVAPVALMAERDQVRSLAKETSALTHGHPTGQFAAAAWAEMLADVASGIALVESANAMADAYARIEGGTETANAIRAALDKPRDGNPETVESLGGGWTAEEALSIALYACLCARSFDHGLQVALLHSGDSDSTGAIAGNMLGLVEPAATLRHNFAGTIECVDVIARIALDYFSLRRKGDAAERLLDFYPGC